MRSDSADDRIHRGAASPTQRKAHGVRSFFFRGGAAVDLIRCTFVENHRDIGVQHLLDFHRNFRRQEEPLTVDRRSKTHAFFGNFAQFAQREDLEAAGVRQNRFLPSHKAVKTAVLGDDFQTGSEPKMERIAEQNLCSDFVELKRAHCFDCTVGADRHKHWRLNNAVVQMDFSAARKSFSFVEFECKTHWFTFCSRKHASP